MATTIDPDLIEQIDRVCTATELAGVTLVGHDPDERALIFATPTGTVRCRTAGRVPTLADILFADQYLSLRAGIDPETLDMSQHPNKDSYRYERLDHHRTADDAV